MIQPLNGLSSELKEYSNPIIPGFYPDPSCILVGDTFYLINSSFQFFPGIPIHKSKDLINWELIGNAICRPEQIRLDWATTKINNASRNEIFTAGIYAPTIRYHSGRFYIVCTFLRGAVDMPADVDFPPENFLITATDLEDPSSFSDLTYFDFHGIDPSLFFDDDGRVYVQGSWIYGYRQHPATVIRQAEIDLETGRLLTPAVNIWGGHTQVVPEGPHLYKKDGWYYLLVAEGGTFHGHKLTMSRSRDIWGPYESFSGNPVLTAEGSTGPVQCVGHGELFQDLSGQWWAVVLARREYGGDCYPLGRETYMTPVQWPENEFPTFAPVEIMQECGRPMVKKAAAKSPVVVSLNSPSTLYLRSPELKNYTQSGKEITLIPTEAALGAPSGPLTFVGQRQTSLDSVAQVLLSLDGLGAGNICCGLTIYKDTFRYAALEYDARESRLSLKVQEAETSLATLFSLSIEDKALLQLSIEASTAAYAFKCLSTSASGGTETITLGEVRCSALSGDDFTGTVFAIFATGDKTPVTFRDFQIQG